MRWLSASLMKLPGLWLTKWIATSSNIRAKPSRRVLKHAPYRLSSTAAKALPEHGIEIRNEAGMPVAERVVGHICISGPSLMSGYFGDQVSQDEIAATGWLDTGDLGYLLDGYLYVTGRIKDLIIIRGRNIWPQDIEYIAEQEPEIHSGDAIAFVTVQEKIILQIQCRISDEERRGQLIHALAARIQSEFGVTAAIDLLPPHSIPRTSSGKPARA